MRNLEQLHKVRSLIVSSLPLTKRGVYLHESSIASVVLCRLCSLFSRSRGDASREIEARKREKTLPTRSRQIQMTVITRVAVCGCRDLPFYSQKLHNKNDCWKKPTKRGRK
jgi:hypothetical protein